MHNPLLSGRGFAARFAQFAQYAGFRPKTEAKGGKKKGQEDEPDKEKHYPLSESDSPEHGDIGEDPSDDHMESDDDSERMEFGDDDDDDDDDDDADDDKKDAKKKAKKKAKRAERGTSDNEDYEKSDRDNKEDARRAFRKGRRAENARWVRILSSPHAAANLHLALRLTARNMALTSDDVIAELKDIGRSTASLTRRASNPRIDVVNDENDAIAPDQRANAAIQASWAKAFAPSVEAGERRKAG
jgi:hypothetical protein